MERHFRILGYLFIIYGIWVLVNIVLITLMPGLTGARVVPSGQATVAIVVSIALTAFFVLAGWSLLVKKDWARTIIIAASIIVLFNIPLGTALGIYGLWVMFSEKGRREYPFYAGSSPPELTVTE